MSSGEEEAAIRGIIDLEEQLCEVNTVIELQKKALEKSELDEDIKRIIHALSLAYEARCRLQFEIARKVRERYAGCKTLKEIVKRAFETGHEMDLFMWW